MEININCDLGESSKLHSTENDPLLLKIVNSAKDDVCIDNECYMQI